MQEFYIEMVRHMFRKILFIVGLLNCGGVFAMEEETCDSAATPGEVCVDESLISEEDKRYIANLLKGSSSSLLSDFLDLENAYPYFTDREAKFFREAYEGIESSPCSYRPAGGKIKDSLDRAQEDADVKKIIQDALRRKRK